MQKVFERGGGALQNLFPFGEKVERGCAPQITALWLKISGALGATVSAFVCFGLAWPPGSVQPKDEWLILSNAMISWIRSCIGRIPSGP